MQAAWLQVTEHALRQARARGASPASDDMDTEGGERMSASSYEMVERAAVLTAGPSYDPNTGDISEEAWADWVQLVDDWASMAGDKLLALEAVLDRLSSEHGLHKQRASMHSARVKVLDTQGKRVKGLAVMLLERAAELTGEPKQRMTDGRSVWLQPSQRTVIDDASLVPEGYWVTPPKKVSIKDVRTAIKEGHTVPGARLEESKSPRWGKPRKA